MADVQDPGQERGIARLEAFSDGVFAIAITLLVLDIKVPRGDHNLVGALLAQWPTYVGYVGSFVIIGIWWAGHHAMLDLIARADHTLRLINTLHLMCIAFLPFATALLSEYMTEAGAPFTTSAVVYVGALVLAALTYNATWRYAAANRMVVSYLTPPTVARITRIYNVSLVCYVVAFAFAFVLPVVALAICIGIALYYALPVRGRPHALD
jgi:uncharacterized membrane protein